MDSCRCTCHTGTKRKVHLHYTHHMPLYGTFSFMAAIVVYCYSTCYSTKRQLKYKPTSISFTEVALTGSSQRLMLACVHARRECKWLFVSCCAFLAWLGGSRGKSCSLSWRCEAAVGRAGWMKEAGSQSFLQRRRTWLSAGPRHVNTTLRKRATWKWQDRGAPHECD